MKKLVVLSVIMSLFGILSFAQPIQKASVSSAKTDSTSINSAKKPSESQSLPMTGANKSTTGKAVIVLEEDEDDFDEKELDELEASIAKAKATLGLKSTSTTTSSKSMPSKSREVYNRTEESKLIAPPTTSYQGPSLMINGRVTTDSKTEFKQTILTEEEKKMYNEGGLKVNVSDEIDQDSVYISPTVLPSFAGGVEAMKLFFTQNLKIPEALKGQEIKGRVFVRFVVRKDGRLDKVHLVKGPNDDCNSEAVRVIKMMPPWIPASERGDAVSSYHVLPISFTTKK